MIIQHKWLIDTQLPPKLVNIFIDFGYNAVHTKSFPDGIFFTDTQIRNIALNENRIIVTKDSDFCNDHFKKAKMPPVLYLKIGNISNRDLINLLKLNLPVVISAIESGSKLIIIEHTKMYVF